MTDSLRTLVLTLAALALSPALGAQSTFASADPRPGCTVPGPTESLRPAPTAPPTFAPDPDGVVVMEVESVSATGAWVRETSLAGHSGAGYFRWTGPNLFTQPGVDVLTYQFEVQTAGEYALRLFSQQNHPDSSEENDCWVRVDGGPWQKLFGFQVGFWNQNAIVEGSSDLLQVNLDAGVHVLEFSGRSTNFKIDRADMVPVPVWWADVADDESPQLRQRPLLGGTFSLEVGDPRNSLGLGPGATAFVAMGKFQPGIPCGPVLPNFGEVLFGLPMLVTPVALPYGGPTDPGTFTVTIPNDPSLLGRRFTWQGALAEPGRVVLTNALDVTLGDI